MVTANFTGWLQDELNRRGWDQAELARRADVAQSHLSRVMSQLRNPGPDFCRAIARAFRVPPEDVFRRAGLLPPEPEMKATYREALHLFAQLPEELQRMVLVQMRALLEVQNNALIQPGSQQPASKTTS